MAKAVYSQVKNNQYVQPFNVGLLYINVNKKPIPARRNGLIVFCTTILNGCAIAGRGMACSVRSFLFLPLPLMLIKVMWQLLSGSHAAALFL